MYHTWNMTSVATNLCSLEGPPSYHLSSSVQKQHDTGIQGIDFKTIQDACVEHWKHCNRPITVHCHLTTTDVGEFSSMVRKATRCSFITEEYFDTPDWNHTKQGEWIIKRKSLDHGEEFIRKVTSDATNENI